MNGTNLSLFISKCCCVNAAVIEITINYFELCGSISYRDFDFDDFHMTNARKLIDLNC